MPKGPIGQAKLSCDKEKPFEALPSWTSASMETHIFSPSLKPKDPLEGRAVRNHCLPLGKKGFPHKSQTFG